MKSHYILFTTVFFLLTTSRSNAQNTYLSQKLDNRNGLSNSCINTIYQDSDNLIWFGTYDGLNVFNGASFQVFNYSKGSIAHSMLSNVIYQVVEDKKDNIWICTVAGISKYNKKSGSFKHYLYNDQNTPGRGFIIAISPEGNVYSAVTYGSSINYYDQATDRFKPLIVTGFNSGMVTHIAFDGANNLWLLKGDGSLHVFGKSKNGFTKIPMNYNPEVDNFFYVNKKMFYVTKKGKLYEVNNNLHDKEIVTLPHQVRSMTYYDNRYIFAWSSTGIGEYDEQFKPQNEILSTYPRLNSYRVTSVLPGKDQSLWFGTDGNGIIKVFRKNNFIHVVQGQPNGQPLNIPIRAFCEVNGELWVGTKGNGIITIKNVGQKDAVFSGINSFYTGVDLLDNCVYAIEKANNELIYIGSDAPGISAYDLKNKKLIKWSDIKGSSSLPSFTSVHSILIDRDSSLWLGLNSEGLVHVKLDRNAVGTLSVSYLKQYKFTGNSKGPASDVIYTLAAGSNNTIWVGCRFGGLSLFDKKTETFKTFKASSAEAGLSNSDILSLYKDKKNRLWVGTSFGLNWFNEVDAANKNLVFKKLHVEEGLPNNTIHAISEDNNGNIWISSNKGLAKIDPGSLKITQFKESDGLQSDEFSDNAVWKSSNGNLFFGGIYGFNYFMPEQIQTSKVQPNLLISDLQLGGKNLSTNRFEVFNNEDKNVVASYVLSRDDNYFGLKLQPIEYSNLQKCQYGYFLKGHDKIWHYSNQDPKVSFSNIQPGDYTLLVKWTNGEGTWTNEMPVMYLSVKQYFWLTWPAFFVYSLIISFLGMMYLRYRKNKFIMSQSLILEHTLREKDEEVHQEQLNFFTNIAHELQTPLTLILGSIERYLHKKELPEKEKSSHHFLSIVKQEASRLHYLVHQLLEFRKAESGHLANHLSYLNASNLLLNISALFNPLGEQKELEFTTDIETDIILSTDKDKLEKIIFNLLSNAFKHSAMNEKIRFSAKRLDNAEQLEIVVCNSGFQLSDEDLHRIFERFFVMDGSQQSKISSGIGLAFTRQLVTLLDGAITVKCENNWIYFRVVLPIVAVPIESVSTLIENSERMEKPSYILESITQDQSELKLARNVVELNKKSMLSSFEENHKKNVLIVEDDQSIRFVLRDILSEHYIVYEAGNGNEALKVIHKMIPDLIVSDIMMPDMDGLELCNIVKATPETCHIPFVILTAKSSVEQKIKGYEVGADAYIPKPFHAEHLLIRIKRLIEYQAKLHELFSQEHAPNKIAEAGIKETDKNFIESVIKVIEDNLDHEDLDAAFLEDKMSLSKMQIYRKLKSLTNMTPGELIRNVRLKQAAHLLKSTNLTVSEIFYRTGFNNQSYFYREFKKMYQTSPNDYRAQQKVPVV